jgi:hypothetical protein
MGSGKSEVSKYLCRQLEDSEKLDLDVNANGPVEGLDEVLGKKNVVGELYAGNSHTTDPKWVSEFQRRGYTILSVILNASLDTHIIRLAKRPDKRCRNEIESHYKKFHDDLRLVFSIRAGIEEISIDTDEKQVNQIGDEVLEYLKKKKR